MKPKKNMTAFGGAETVAVKGIEKLKPQPTKGFDPTALKGQKGGFARLVKPIALPGKSRGR